MTSDQTAKSATDAQPSAPEGSDGPGDGQPHLANRIGRRKLLLRAGIGLVITTAILFFLFGLVDWQRAWELQRQLRWSYLVQGFALYLVLYVLRATRFVLLAPRTPFLLMACITAVHNFLLRVLPMRTGDLSYAFLVQRAGTANLGHSLFGLLLLRMLDATAVVVLFGATLALNHGLYRGDAGVSIGVAAGVAALGLVAVLLFPTFLRLGSAILEWGARLTGLLRWPRMKQLLAHLREAVTTYCQGGLSTRLVWQAGAITVAHWLCNYAIVHAIMHACGIRVSYAQAVLGGTGATVTGFLPVAGIGSFGPLEAGWALGFALVGLDASLAVASGFAFSIITFAYAAILAALGWAALGRLARKLPANAATASPT